MTFDNIQNVKSLLSLLDFQSLKTYYESPTTPFENPETSQIVSEKGYRPAAKHLLQKINRDPAEQTAIAEEFGLTDLGDPPRITAAHLCGKVLTDPAGRRDLRQALQAAKKLTVSPQTKKVLADLLRILDLLSGETAFEALPAYKEKGIIPAIKELSAALSGRDRLELARIFGLQENWTPKVLQETVLNRPEDETDLTAALCQVDSRECSAVVETKDNSSREKKEARGNGALAGLKEQAEILKTQVQERLQPPASPVTPPPSDVAPAETPESAPASTPPQPAQPKIDKSVVKQILINPIRRNWGWGYEIIDQGTWRGLSFHLYGTEEFADDLKDLNGGVRTPADAYKGLLGDWYLPGEAVRVYGTKKE